MAPNSSQVWACIPCGLHHVWLVKMPMCLICCTSVGRLSSLDMRKLIWRSNFTEAQDLQPRVHI